MMTASSREQVICQAKRHWIRLLLPCCFLMVGLFCTLCSVLTAMKSPDPEQSPPPPIVIDALVSCSACILGVAFLGILIVFFDYLDFDFTLTNRRIIFNEGIFRKRSLEIFLHHADSVYIEQSILGQLLGYGTVVIQSQASQPQMTDIANPQAIRHHIQEQIARLS